jgi:uncharacterized MAPEG superfamily protein
MTYTHVSFFGLIIYQALSLLLLASYRSVKVFQKQIPKGGFAPDGSGTTPLGQRIVRVHANGYENIPFFLAVFLYSFYTGRADQIANFAMIILCSRIAQGLIHLYSTEFKFIMLRFSVFFIQILALLLCIQKLVK